jgi:primosomal protein N' (replication factor Y) (superfamily II helicase)
VPAALDVWLPLPVPPLLYLAPHGEALPVAGARVAVPWQGGVRVGVVAEVVEVSAAKALELKEAIALLDDAPWVVAPVRRMLAAQAARAVASPGVALAVMLAAGLSDEPQHELAAVPGVDPEAFGAHAAALRDGAWIDADDVPRDTVSLWRDHGLVRERVRPRPERIRVLRPLRPVDDQLAGRRRENQRGALEHLAAVGETASAAELARAADVPESAVRTLVAKGYAGYVEVDAPLPSPPWAVPSGHEPPRPDGAFPTGERRVLVTGGRARDRLAWLCAGVAADVAAHGQVLVLAPELAAVDTLAPALAGVAPTLVVRGDIEPRVREAAWREAARGHPLVVLGTFQSLTMPLPRLVRVMVWDAASPSHKLIKGTRSVTRRDAEILADAARASIAYFDPVSTPELRATRASRSVRLPLPRLRLVPSDMRASTTWPLGPDLIRTLRQVAERERQALVIVPRRGYASGLACRDCGVHVMCPNCDLPLRWHARAERLRCHQCGHARRAPERCTDCGGHDFAPLPGAGTEWVAQEVARVAPRLEVVTVDRDHRPDLSRLYQGAPGVVVGTTAALRLEPLPVLSLIALTLGDALYGHEDFRAEEGALRTMLTLMDVAGERRPLVLIQTFRPDHALWSVLSADDIDEAVTAFERDLEARRRRFGYPPARQWARVQVTHRDRASARRAAVALAAALRTAGVGDDAMLGPAPASVARLRGRYAEQLYLRADDDVRLADALAAADLRLGSGVRTFVDVDPYDVVAWLE